MLLNFILDGNIWVKFTHFNIKDSRNISNVICKTLDLSSNHLSESIPNLTNFSSLKELVLYDNQWSGTVLESIGHVYAR
ncbi:hypothetical protein ACFX2J_000728 [Malus domestica]